jgi:hypothetical protein
MMKVCSMISAEVRTCKFLSWNVRGLDDPSKRINAKNFIMIESLMYCLQETKLNSITDSLLREIMGNSLDSRVFILVDGTA